MIENLKISNKPGLLLFADFEKAFDSVDHNFIWKCLRYFNFGESFIRWIKLFYNDIFSLILNNGHLSEHIPIQRGVRQGCPLSSFLFVICIEILANYIKHNHEIKGVIIKNIEIKQSLFSDDATFFNNGTKESFEKIIEILDQFEKESGLKLNTQKTTILRIGSLRDTDIKYCRHKKIIWTSDSANTLRMTFTNNLQENIIKNIEPKLISFKNCLKQWDYRKLTLMGKITVIKSFALPKLVYPFTVLPNPSENITKDIIKSCYEFIWENKPEKVKRKLLKLDYQYGGLKMIDIKTFLYSLKASWIKRILDKNSSGAWKTFYKNKLEKFGGDIIFDCNIGTKEIENICQEMCFSKIF